MWLWHYIVIALYSHYSSMTVRSYGPIQLLPYIVIALYSYGLCSYYSSMAPCWAIGFKKAIGQVCRGSGSLWVMALDSYGPV